MFTMNKQGLVNAVEHDMKAQGFPIESHAQTERIVSCVLDNMVGAIKAEGKLLLPGLGSFTVRPREARKFRNIHTGEIVECAARNGVVFKPSQSLRKAVM